MINKLNVPETETLTEILLGGNSEVFQIANIMHSKMFGQHIVMFYCENNLFFRPAFKPG